MRLFVVVMALLLAGCVTTEEPTFKGGKIDREEAVNRHVDLALNYLARNDTQMAQKHLAAARERDDGSARVHEGLALYYMKTEDFKLAEEAFRRALSLDASASRIRYNYAFFLIQRERLDDAMVELEKVVADTLYDRRSEAYAQMGGVLLTQGKQPQGIESLQRAVALKPSNGPALLELANIYYGQGEYGRSLELLGRYRDVARPTPRSLLLGVRLARIAHDKDAEASYMLQLKNLFPTSSEYLQSRRESVSP